MITFAKCAVTKNGTPYATLKAAQEAELAELLVDAGMVHDSALGVAQLIVENADPVIDILTTNTKSRPRARKLNGGTKPRKTKASVPPAAQAPL